MAKKPAPPTKSKAKAPVPDDNDYFDEAPTPKKPTILASTAPSTKKVLEDLKILEPKAPAKKSTDADLPALTWLRAFQKIFMVSDKDFPSEPTELIAIAVRMSEHDRAQLLRITRLYSEHRVKGFSQD